MEKPSAAHKADSVRVVAGFAVVGLALLAVVAIYVRTVGDLKDPAAIAALASGAFGIVGTLVGVYFGVNVGTQGKADDQQSRENAENLALQLAARLPKDEVREAMEAAKH